MEMLVILSVILILFCCTAQPDFVNYKCDNTYGIYTTNSTYQKNLKTLLSDISSDTKIAYGFYNFSSGEDPNIVNGIGLCRGDVSLGDCRTCMKDATAELFGLCTNQKQAIGWYDNCMLRYSNQPLFRVMEIAPSGLVNNPNKALDQNNFVHVLSNLFGSLINKTMEGSSTLKFAMNMANVSTVTTIYAFTQCTPDLSHLDCNTCLSDSISYLSTCCLPYEGVRYFQPSCNIRYEVFKFSSAFDTLASANLAEPPSSPPPTLALSSAPTPIPIPTLASIPGKVKRRTPPKIVIAIVVITVVCLLLAVVIYLCLRLRRRKLMKTDSALEEEDEITTVETLQIAYGDIKDATQGFAEVNKLGKGGFGTVYKGVLSSGKEIAVKRLATNSVQGEAEFRTEVLLVAKLQHRNLVKLLGYSFEGEERLLIYEFMPNSSLDHLLFGRTQVSLEWHTRYRIIQGIARGLLYLHEDSRLRIIHRDLKASNILLDARLNPKIADFGMARLLQADQTHADTEQIAGTFGYMAPEYVYRGIISVKSDVYSFGVLVLEIIYGQKNSGFLESDNMEDLISLAWRNWREGTTCEVVDPALVSASRAQLMRCIQIGLLCVQVAPTDRPTMSLVNLMLNSESQTMPVPLEPAYALQRSIGPKSLNTTEEESITELHSR